MLIIKILEVITILGELKYLRYEIQLRKDRLSVWFLSSSTLFILTIIIQPLNIYVYKFLTVINLFMTVLCVKNTIQIVFFETKRYILKNKYKEES